MLITKNTIEKLKNHDEKTFNKIYHEYESLVYYICYSITLNKEASEDLTQDTFLKLLTSIDTYNEDGHFKQYLMQIARNLSKNYVIRIMNKEKTIEDEEVSFDSFSSSNNDRINTKVILELQSILNETEANVVILKVVYNFKFNEIAEDSNKTIGEIQSLYYRAIEKVKKAYKEAKII